MLAATRGDFTYDILLLLHILVVVVGFGSTFVWPYLGAQGKKAGGPVGKAFSDAALAGAPWLTTYPIYAAGLTGILLIVANDAWEFSQTWISIAFGLYIVAIGVSHGLHTPNLKAMNALMADMASAGPPAEGSGPPPQVAELDERGKKAAMFGGILHLLFLAMLVDMVFKPGL